MTRYVTGSTGIVVTVPEAETIVADVRFRLDPAAGYGVPPHVTVLFPWLPIESIGDAALSALAELATGFPCFAAELSAVGRFPGVGWLAPSPSEPFVALTQAVWRRWPQTPPYQGRFVEPVPHLTVADGQPESVLDAVTADLTLLLPIRFRVNDLVLLGFNGARWKVLERFPLLVCDGTNQQSGNSGVGIA